MAVLTLAMVSAGTSTVRAEAETATGVENVQASIEAGEVVIRGTARFVDAPGLVGTDVSGDTEVDGRGADVVSATISRPEAFSDRLQLSLGIADLPSDAPAVGVDYIWCFEFLRDGIDTPPVAIGRYILQAFRKPGGGPGFRLGGGSPCSSVPVPTASGTINPDPNGISGSVGGGRITFDVPFQKVSGMKPGSVIRAWQVSDLQGTRTAHIGSSIGLLGFQWYGSLDTIAVSPYTVPGPTVLVGVAPVGTPVDQVPLTTSAVVKADSTFNASISTEGLASGEHIVVARACYGKDNCGHATTSFSP